MACNCINEKQEHIKNNLSQKSEEYADKNIQKVTFKNGIITNEGEELYAVASIEYLNSKGNYNKKTVNFGFKYCPFCGKAYEEE